MKQNKNFFVGLLVAIVIIAGIVVAIGSGHKPSTPSKAITTSPTRAVATDAVSIQDYAFTPMVIKVKAGTTVTWTNKDSVHHSIVADTASSNAPAGPLIGQGQTYTFTFDKTGTYTFHCAAHPYMHGIVEVTN